MEELRDADIAEQAPCPLEDRSTPREREVIHLVALGLTNREVGERLRISKATVKKHLSNIYRSVGVRSRRELVGYALRVGIVATAGVSPPVPHSLARRSGTRRDRANPEAQENG